MIVHANEPVTLIGGGVVTADELAAARALAPRLVAADGGADRALALGAVPEAVIGDFDSLSAAARAAIPPDAQHPVPEQDSTDFEKCLTRIDAPLVIGVGFCGARVDHQLAVCNVLVRHPDRRCAILGPDDVLFLCPPSLALDLAPGTRLSLFPMGAVEGVSDGLEWPIGGLNFAPDGMVGTSNRATGPVELSLTAPKMLGMVPVRYLHAVVTMLLTDGAGW